MANKIKQVQMYQIETLLDILESQFKFIMGEDPEYYSKYNFILENEQSYVSEKGRREPGNIYMVVKFLPAEINYGQNIIPFTITAISEHNKFNACQRLLLEYSQFWNLKKGEKPYLDDDALISYNQTYDGPSVMSNFNDVYHGYRSILIMSGSFLLSYNINTMEYYYYTTENSKGELLEVIGNVSNTDFNLDTQPFTNKQNFTSSMTKFATNSLNITIFLTNSEICNKALKLKHKSLPVNQNDFILGIKYRNQADLNGSDETPFISHYKLQNIAIANNMGEMPTISLSFTN